MISAGRTVKLGIKSLMLHKLRTGLTTLGIVFGVAAVIAVLAVGEGGSQAQEEMIKELGSTNILLRSRKPPEAQQTQQVSMWTAQEYGLSYQDAEVIAQTMASVKVVVPVRETPKDVWAGGRKLLGKVFGTIPARAITVLARFSSRKRYIFSFTWRRRSILRMSRWLFGNFRIRAS